MAESDASSIREVLEEAVKPEADAGSDDAAAEQPTSTETADDSSSEPKSPRKEEEPAPLDAKLRQGIDEALAELPPEKRASIQKQLKDYDRGFHRSMAKVAEFRKFAEGLASRFPGVTGEELLDAMGKHRSPAPTTSAKSDAQGVDEEDIDALINKAADPAVREELRKSRAVLHREMDKRLTEKLKPLQDELEQLKRTATTGRASVVEQDIDALEEAQGLPSAFVEKYRGEIRAYALKWNLPAKEVLPKVVPFDELREALAASTTSVAPKKPSTGAPHRTVSAPASKNGSLDAFKERRGGWNIKGALRSLVKA